MFRYAAEKTLVYPLARSQQMTLEIFVFRGE
jgi:hypothetical protein